MIETAIAPGNGILAPAVPPAPILLQLRGERVELARQLRLMLVCVTDNPRFEAAPRTKRAKGTKQTSPITSTTRTSLNTNCAPIVTGRRIRIMISPTNNMLA